MKTKTTKSRKLLVLSALFVFCMCFGLAFGVMRLFFGLIREHFFDILGIHADRFAHVCKQVFGDVLDVVVLFGDLQRDLVRLVECPENA